MTNIKNIIGYEKEVKRLESICDFLKHTDMYTDFDIKLPKGMLICGRLGVGKTFMAEALIEDSGRDVFYYDNNVHKKKYLKRIFKKAKKAAPSIIFFDDLDIVDDCESDFYFQLLDEMNDADSGEVFIIATVEDKDNLPNCLLNEITSEFIIELDTPNIDEACKIFKPIFNEEKVDESFDIKDFCCFAQYWSYSMVETAYNNALRLAVAERREKMIMPHMIHSCLLQQGYMPANEFDVCTAYHEAGHAAVNLLLGGDAGCIVLLESGAGYFKEKNREIKRYTDKERRYTVCVAGKACEEIFMGTSSMGSYNDLYVVSTEMEADIKVLASQGFEYFDSTELNSPAYNDMLAKKVQSDIQKYFDKAKDLINQNKPLIEELVNGLKDKFYLLHSEIHKIYNEYISSLSKDDNAHN